MAHDTDTLRDLLSRVASGDLDPAEAARLLDEDPTLPTLDSSLSAQTDVALGSIAIHAGGVKLTVVADPTVDAVVADGPHSLRRDGGTLVLEAPAGDGWRTTPPPRFLSWVPSVWTGGRGEKVLVRVNPRLPLSVEATACSVEVTGLRAALTLGGSASSVKVRDHEGALQAGPRTAQNGESRAADLGGAVEVEDAEMLAELVMGQRREIELGRPASCGW